MKTPSSPQRSAAWFVGSFNVFEHIALMHRAAVSNFISGFINIELCAVLVPGHGNIGICPADNTKE
ncbi:MAG: hypothetical protein ACI9SP_004367 [Arenicella sp.]|jgi:hypothetical protein